MGQLLAAPASLAQLYNDYASRFRLWPQAIQAVDLARHDDGRFICQLWDVALRQVRRTYQGCVALNALLHPHKARRTSSRQAGRQAPRIGSPKLRAPWSLRELAAELQVPGDPLLQTALQACVVLPDALAPFGLWLATGVCGAHPD